MQPTTTIPRHHTLTLLLLTGTALFAPAVAAQSTGSDDKAREALTADRFRVPEHDLRATLRWRAIEDTGLIDSWLRSIPIGQMFAAIDTELGFSLREVHEIETTVRWDEGEEYTPVVTYRGGDRVGLERLTQARMSSWNRVPSLGERGFRDAWEEDPSVFVEVYPGLVVYGAEQPITDVLESRVDHPGQPKIDAAAVIAARGNNLALAAGTIPQNDGLRTWTFGPFVEPFEPHPPTAFRVRVFEDGRGEFVLEVLLRFPEVGQGSEHAIEVINDLRGDLLEDPRVVTLRPWCERITVTDAGDGDVRATVSLGAHDEAERFSQALCALTLPLATSTLLQLTTRLREMEAAAPAQPMGRAGVAPAPAPVPAAFPEPAPASRPADDKDG